MTTALESASLSRNDRVMLLANMIDHFDSALYGLLVPVLAPLFKAGMDQSSGVVALLLMLATASVTKPLGAVIFGRLAAKRGPQIALSISLMLMGGCCALMALLPDANMVGSAAMVMLLLLRLIMGVVASGESTIARILIGHGKQGQLRAQAVSNYEISTMFGVLMASLSVSMLFELELDPSWGWRLLYAFGAIVSAFGWYLRHNIMMPKKF